MRDSTIIGVEVEIPPGKAHPDCYHQECFDRLYGNATDDEVEFVHQIGRYETEPGGDFEGLTCVYCHAELAEPPVSRPGNALFYYDVKSGQVLNH